jgi:outer membrane receptor for ferrienterochelin and colicins
MQGMDGSKVKILMDGVPVNGRENGNIDLGQLNTYNLERIEIIQGPMSVVYGTDALGGVINLISKNVHQKSLGISGQAYYESVGKYNFTATAHQSFGKHNFTLGGGRNFFDGVGKLSDDTASYGPHRTSIFKPKEQYLGNFNYSFNPSEKLNLRVASDFVKEKVTNKGIAFITPYEGRAVDDYYRTSRSVNRITLSGKLKNGGSYQLINGYSYYRRVKNTYVKNLVNLQEELSTASGMQDTSTFHEYNFRGMYENVLFKKLNYTLGYDVDLQKGVGNKIPATHSTINDYAAFANLSYSLVKDKLDIQGGLRVPYNTVYKAPIIPTFNLLYKCAPTVRVRASYARGFRAPGLKELYLEFVDNNHHIFGNPNLKAEIGDHVQGSISWMVFEKASNYSQVLLTGYYNNVHNQIALAQRYPMTQNSDSAQYYDYTNILAMRNTIATLEFEGQYSNFHYKLGYSYNYTFAQTGQYTGFGAHEVTTTLQYYWKRSKVNFSIFNRINGARPFLQSNIDGTSTYSGRQPSYDMMDASVSRKFWKQQLQLTAGVKNIWNVTTFTAGTVTNSAHSTGGGNVSFMPRSFFTSLRFNFK